MRTRRRFARSGATFVTAVVVWPAFAVGASFSPAQTPASETAIRVTVRRMYNRFIVSAPSLPSPRQMERGGPNHTGSANSRSQKLSRLGHGGGGSCAPYPEDDG